MATFSYAALTTVLFEQILNLFQFDAIAITHYPGHASWQQDKLLGSARPLSLHLLLSVAVLLPVLLPFILHWGALLQFNSMCYTGAAHGVGACCMFDNVMTPPIQPSEVRDLVSEICEVASSAAKINIHCFHWVCKEIYRFSFICINSKDK